MKKILTKSAMVLAFSMNFLQGMMTPEQYVTARWRVVYETLKERALVLMHTTAERKNLYLSHCQPLPGIQSFDLTLAAQALLSNYNHNHIYMALKPLKTFDLTTANEVMEYNRNHLKGHINGNLGELMDFNLQEAVDAARQTDNFKPYGYGLVLLLIKPPFRYEKPSLITLQQITLIKVIDTLLVNAHQKETMEPTVALLAEELIKQIVILERARQVKLVEPCFIQ